MEWSNLFNGSLDWICGFGYALDVDEVTHVVIVIISSTLPSFLSTSPSLSHHFISISFEWIILCFVVSLLQYGWRDWRNSCADDVSFADINECYPATSTPKTPMVFGAKTVVSFWDSNVLGGYMRKPVYRRWNFYRKLLGWFDRVNSEVSWREYC